jgi:hypothetical protein
MPGRERLDEGPVALLRPGLRVEVEPVLTSARRPSGGAVLDLFQGRAGQYPANAIRP